MSIFNRRSFLQASFAGVVSLSQLPSRQRLAADDKQRESAKRSTGDTPVPQFNQGSPDTLFLTWQRDPTTTITASWVGEELPNEETEVRFAELDSTDWILVQPTRHAYPGGVFSVYRAEATELKPGTQYRLRIGKGAQDHRFQTMPAKATDSFQFVSGGDCGWGAKARESNNLAARQDPMFVLMGGDIAYDNGLLGLANLGFLKNYTSDMLDSAGRLIPIVPAIGNHETTRLLGGLRAPFFQSLYGGLFAERSYATLDFGDYLSLVLLDSGHMAPIEGEQTSWLDEQLAERTERPHLVVAQHVPSYPSYRSYNTTGRASRQEWVPLFQKHNVDIVLEHHDHTFKRTHPLQDGLVDKRGLVYLGDGSWGALRQLHEAESRPYLATASSNYHVTLHRLEGEQRFHMALANSGRVVDVCTTSKRPRRSMGRGS